MSRFLVSIPCPPSTLLPGVPTKTDQSAGTHRGREHRQEQSSGKSSCQSRLHILFEPAEPHIDDVKLDLAGADEFLCAEQSNPYDKSPLPRLHLPRRFHGRSRPIPRKSPRSRWGAAPPLAVPGSPG